MNMHFVRSIIIEPRKWLRQKCMFFVASITVYIFIMCIVCVCVCVCVSEVDIKYVKSMRNSPFLPLCISLPPDGQTVNGTWVKEG